MIDPTEADVGRSVVYRSYPSAAPEEGVITSMNESYVFVRYGVSGGSQATNRSDLEWSSPHEYPTIRSTLVKATTQEG